MVLGCRAISGPRHGPEERRLEQAKSEARSGGEVSTAARWVFRPRGPAEVSARLATAEGELVVDRGGSRWLVRKGRDPEPSPHGAPEPLVGLRPRAPGFAFVGQSGSVYLAASALGPFEATRRPSGPGRTFGAAQSGDVILAVGEDGQLRRSADLGITWQRLSLDAFVTDVALDEAGHALALSVPEAWLWSEDSGATFRGIAPGYVAPRALSGGRPGFWVQGFLGDFELSAGRFARREAARETARTWPLAGGASPLLVLRREATLAREYLALDRSAGRLRAQWGELGVAPAERSVTGLERCVQVQLARAGERVAALCLGPDAAGVSPELRLLRAELPALDFKESALLRGDWERARLALSRAGDVALLGICAAASREAGCSPLGVHVLEPEARAPAAVPVPLETSRGALAFLPSGTLLFAGVRDKDGHVVVVLRPPGEAGFGRAVDVSRELGQVGPAQSVELLPSDGPYFGVSLREPGGTTVATLDEQGAIVTWGAAPDSVTAVHGAGFHFGAVVPGKGLFYESVDGGITWQTSALPRSPCASRTEECRPPLVCSDAGCLLGEELTRVGWGAASSEPALSMVRPRQGARGPAHGYVCHADAEQALELPHMQSAPGASDAALGQADFTEVEVDAQSGEVRFVWLPRGERTLRREVGLGAVPDPHRYALTVVPQVEGAAALRFRTPEPKTSDRYLSEIEVAWNNRVADVAARTRLPGPVLARSGDFRPSTTGVGEAFPKLLSVAGRGVYLQLHQDAERSQPVYFIESARIEELKAPLFPGPAGDLLDVEYIQSGGRHVPIAFSADRRMVVVADGTSPRDVEAAVLLREPPLLATRLQGTRLSYWGDRIGVVSMMADFDETFWSARFAPFGEDSALGPVLAVPLQSALGLRPLACTEAVRLATPRIVAPAFPGSTRQVSLELEGERRELVLGAAVLHGTPQDPCVAAWEGEPGPGEPKGRLLLLPRPDGWFGYYFAPREAPQRGGYDAWPLRCTAR